MSHQSFQRHNCKVYFCAVRIKNRFLNNVSVDDYAAGGKALAKVDGKVIFIENAVPGDVVDVVLDKSKKDWAEGKARRFHQYSAQRVAPFCQHFGMCGGCQWQMLPYEQQLIYKQKEVTDNLSRIGKVALPEILPIIGCDENKYYRNKLEYTFSTKQFIPDELFRTWKAEGKDVKVLAEQSVAGFHAKGMFDKLVEITTCYLQKEPTNALRNSVADFARKNNISFYDINSHSGWLRNIQVRITEFGEIMVNIIAGHHDKRNAELLFAFINEKFPSLTTLLYTVNEKRNDSIFDLEPQTIKGKGFIMEKLEEFVFKIGPKSFFQTNTKQAEKLYNITRNFAGLTGNEIVYDLYCGTGSIGIFLSKGAKKIVGVEVIEAAVKDAKENAKLNNINSAQFFVGDVIDICNDDFFAAHGKPDVIIIDPPRAGLHKDLVEKLLSVAANRIVYVSCNPATQARDINLLDAKYSVEKIQPVDMFPHTYHIENVVQLQLK